MQAVSNQDVATDKLSNASFADGCVISEVEFTYSDNSEIGEGMCSCVCINDEGCCGCPAQ